MLRQVNIDGVLYKIGDSRFEGDNLAYIQLPESITVGTPLTDLAPIQKALDSTDGSLLYAPSLNIFFAPTASSTPDTTRIWASTTGDKGYQLKATLNESGILSSAVVVEAPAAEGAYIIEYDDLDCIFVTDPTTLATTPEAIALAQRIIDHKDCPTYIHVNMIPTIDDYLLLNHYSLNGVDEKLCYHFVADKCVFLENARIEINVGIDAASGLANGGSCYSNSFSLENYKDLLEASDALAADKKYVDTELAIKIAKLLKNSVNPSIRGDIIWKYNTNTFINTKHEYDWDEECDVDTFEMPTKVDDTVLGGTLIYPITVYSKTEGKVTTYLGAVVKPPTTDHVVVSKEYMEVPTGHASHTCLEASISGTTLNITHKNESHISSVIHVPNSVLFTSDAAFELKFAPGMFATSYTPDAKFEISKDGLTWNQAVWDDGVTLKADTLNSELGKYSVFIKGDNHITKSEDEYCSFSVVDATEDIEVSGILDALWGGKDPVPYAAKGMFTFMMGLIDAKNLVLPTKASAYMYQDAFMMASIITAPQLPATTLAEHCYEGMFNNCTALTSVPAVLPATTLADSCYMNMFNGCSALASIPQLPATTLTEHCYDGMFSFTALTATPKLPANILADYCYNQMFNGCSALTLTSELPATTLTDHCYYEMFMDCTSITSAPELPATTLATSCYFQMFQGCTSLAKAPELPATTLPERCYTSMFQGCTSLTKPVVFPEITTITNCMGSMFMHCTGIKWATSGTPYIIKTTDGSTTTPYTTDMFKNNGGSPLPGGSGTPDYNTVYYLKTGGTNKKFTVNWTDYAKEHFEETMEPHRWGVLLEGAQISEAAPWYNVDWFNAIEEDYIIKGDVISADGTINLHATAEYKPDWSSSTEKLFYDSTTKVEYNFQYYPSSGNIYLCVYKY